MARECVESLSWPPTDLDAVCLPKALPVAALDDLEKATKEWRRQRGKEGLGGGRVRSGEEGEGGKASI